jgi:hypothetical protein
MRNDKVSELDASRRIYSLAQGGYVYLAIVGAILVMRIVSPVRPAQQPGAFWAAFDLVVPVLLVLGIVYAFLEARNAKAILSKDGIAITNWRGGVTLEFPWEQLVGVIQTRPSLSSGTLSLEIQNPEGLRRVIISRVVTGAVQRLVGDILATQPGQWVESHEGSRLLRDARTAWRKPSSDDKNK